MRTERIPASAGRPALRWRYERFGGIVACEDPPLLAFLDRQGLRALGVADAACWSGEPGPVDRLSAPTEVHVTSTLRCDVGCEHCYVSAGEAPAAELDTAAALQQLDALAELGVFHLALGGGEALLRPDLLALAERARSLGMVPNLTVSGARLDADWARALRIFGQVNVSLDGVGALQACHGRRVPFAQALAALDHLVAAGVPAGINCVLGRANFDGLDDLFALAAAHGANEVECLRLKPVGRARESYERRRLTPTQGARLMSLLAQLSARCGVPAKIDCSFVPWLCATDPPLELLQGLATYGCEAGNVLLGLGSDGRVAGCSFLPPLPLQGVALPALFLRSPALEALRSVAERLGEPCRSCPYLGLCKGGCRAVALAVTGDLEAPDPECPRVLAAAEGGV